MKEAILLTDGYKLDHRRQYPENTEYVYSNWTPRGTKHIEELHDLGYLPIRIKALPEGTLCPIRVSALTFINTHPDFFWLTTCYCWS